MKSGGIRDQRGFTLPELLVTIVVLGILLAIAVPSWSSYTEARRVESAKNQLVSDLRLASTLAQNRLIYVRVELTAGSGDYVMRNAEGGEPTLNRTLPEGTVATSDEVIVFTARGTAGPPPEGEPIRDYTVSVASEDGDSPLSIKVAGATARVGTV